MFYKCPIFIYSINIIPFPFLKQVILSISIENKNVFIIFSGFSATAVLFVICSFVS